MISRPVGMILVLLALPTFFFLTHSSKSPPKPVTTPTITVPNSSVEEVSKPRNEPRSWRSARWGDNTTQFEYLLTGHTGKHSLKTTISSYATGDAKWYFDLQPVVPGEAYTFSDYYQSNVPSRVVVQFTKKNGVLFYKELKPAQTAKDWSRYEASFTIPADVKNMTVLHLLSAAGFLITDDYQITHFVPEGFSRGLVSITWDDGVESQYTQAFPLHKKYQLPGSFFLISGSLDQKNFMTTDQAQEIQKAGNELGSHTATHPHLATLGADDITRELEQSQTDLRAKFKTSFEDFVTPYGEYNDQVTSAIKTYYRSNRSVENWYNAKNNFDIYNIAVQNVYTTTTPSQVESWVKKAKTDKTWLVLVYHQVDNPDDQYSVSRGDLEAEFRYLKESTLPVVTIDQALKEIMPQVTTP